jgi:hypothetical protein
MKISLISLIALALTSTSVMAAVAVEKRALLPGVIKHDVKKGRKTPQINAHTSGFYKKGDTIKFSCFTNSNTTPVLTDK